MAKIKLSSFLFVCFMIVGLNVNGQTNTFPSSGNAGIGILSPEELLHILGNTSSDVTLKIENSATNGEAQIHLRRFQSDWKIINEHHLFFEREGNTYVTFNEDGLIGIGTENPTVKLAVNGTAKAKKMVVTEQASEWPDFVFEDDYQLPSLISLQKYVKKFKHLPGLPSAENIQREGQNLGSVQSGILKQVEELLLFVIELKQENENQSILINELRKEINFINGKVN